MNRLTSNVGWAASGTAGLAVFSSHVVRALEQSLASGALGAAVNGVLGLFFGALTMVVGRALWEVTGRVLMRWGIKPRPVECPIGLAHCPLSAAAQARASSHDLSSYRDTKPEKD